MIVDVDYGQYRIGAFDEGVEIGEPGTLSPYTGGALVRCFTQAGPVNVRVLVGDHAPGHAEDGWRSEWESAEEVVLDAGDDFEVRTWEFGQSDPPSGPLAPPGQWRLRFHVRGSDKVDHADGYPESPLEEHLILLWPEGAPVGASPVWDEVTGVPLAGQFTLHAFNESGRIRTPGGFYRLTGAETNALTVVPEPGASLQQNADDDLVISSGTTTSFEVLVMGSEHGPRNLGSGGWWRAVEDGHIFSTRPVRIVESDGRAPRRFSDPLLPPGRWRVRLIARIEEPEGIVSGLPIATAHRGAPFDQHLEIWPA